MADYIPISEAKPRLSELVHRTEEEDVVLMRHGRPAAVMLSVDRHAEIMQQLDDLEDRLSVHESEGDTATVPWDKLKVELGLGDEQNAVA